jgi:hypothetical protein
MSSEVMTQLCSITYNRHSDNCNIFIIQATYYNVLTYWGMHYKAILRCKLVCSSLATTTTLA